MADEIAELNIDINLDPSDAIQGAQSIQQALDQTGDAVTEMGADTQAGTTKADAALQGAVDSMKAELAELRSALAGAAKGAQGMGNDIPAATTPAVEGLDDLQESAGQAAGGIGAIGGAISVANPMLGAMFTASAALVSGFEGAVRITRVFGATVVRMLGPIALAATAIGAVTFAVMKFRGSARAAVVDTDSLLSSMNALGAAQAAQQDIQLQLRVERGELTQLEAELLNVEETVRGRFSGALASSAEGVKEQAQEFAKWNEAVGRLRGELESAGNDMQRTAQVSAELRNAEMELRDATEGLNEASENQGRTTERVNTIMGRAVEAQREILEIRQRREKQALADARRAKAEQDELAEKARLEESLRKSIEEQERALDMLAEARGREAVILRAYGKEVLALNEMLEDGSISVEQYTELLDHAADQQVAAMDAIAQARQQELDLAKQAASASLEVEGGRIKDVREAYNERVLALQESFDAEEISAEEHAQFMIDLEQDKNKKIEDIRARNAEVAIATASMVAGLVGDAYNRELELSAAEIDKAEEAALSKAGDSLEAQEKIRKDFDQRRKDELASLFDKQKDLEIANALISAASASVAALAAPPTGLGPVAGLALLPLIAATAAGQIATIQQQQPSFHQGGIVGGNGDQLVNAQAGEVVLNRDTVARMGGADSANSLNGGAGMGQPVVIELTYKQKVMDRVIADSLRKGGPLKSALNDATRIGRRGRIGGRL
jgi:hypothetical protein